MRSKNSITLLSNPEFSLRVAYPLKDEDHLKRPIAFQASKTKLHSKKQSESSKRRIDYAQ